MIEYLIIENTASILEAIKQMDKIKKKLLIVFSNKEFLGLLSIGDIQRAIINNIKLDTSINEILRRDIILANESDSLETIRGKMLKMRAEFMPVVNKKNEITKVIFWEDLFANYSLPPKKQFNLPVVIMAGGKGTRLKPITNVLPKPLIPIGEKTIIEHIFDNFREHGCKEFHVSVNYKASLIDYYLKEQQLPYNLKLFKESKPMGTAGSLSLLREEINNTFFVSNCDIIIEQDYSEILDYHNESKNEITVVSALKTYSVPYGTIETKKRGKLVKLVEKPDLTFQINSGMYILEPHLLNEIPNDEFFHITELIKKIVDRKGKVGVFPVSEESWKDIGEWDEYLKNKEYIR